MTATRATSQPVRHALRARIYRERQKQVRFLMPVEPRVRNLHAMVALGSVNLSDAMPKDVGAGVVWLLDQMPPERWPPA